MLAIIANVNRDPKKRTTPFTERDFLMKFGEDTLPTRNQTWQEKDFIFRIMAMMHASPAKKAKEKPKAKAKT